MKNFILAGVFLSFAALVATSSFAGDKTSNAADDIALDDYSAKNYKFLYPGFHFEIQPGAEGGQSISALYDGEGFVVCYSQVNPSNEAVPAPFHCNQHITPLGYHVSAKFLFDETGLMKKVKGGLELGSTLGVQGLSSFSEAGKIAETAAAASGAIQASNSKIIASHQLANTTKLLKDFAKKGEKGCDATFPAVLSSYYFANLIGDLAMQVQASVADCNNKRNSSEKKPEEKYCHQQLRNQDMAANVMTACNMQPITAQAGEVGNAELWYPGQPILASCVNKLKLVGIVKKDAAGRPVKDKDGKMIPVLDPNDVTWNISHEGAQTLDWIAKQDQKLQGLAPGSPEADAKVADHVEACLAGNEQANVRLQQAKSRVDLALKPGGALTTIADPISTTSAGPGGTSQ